MKIYNSLSPNFNKKKRSIKLIKYIVLHYTGMQSERESIKRLRDPLSEVSSHYLINKKGKIFRLVNDRFIAWHAGKSCWKKRKNLNKNSIGIELVNNGHEFGYTNFKTKQILALIKLSKILIKKYKIKANHIIAHSDIAPLRKIDPGEKFPWKYLSRKKIGVWHDHKSYALKKYRKLKITDQKDKEKFIKLLKKIGYCFPSKKKLFLKIFQAFHRHFRKDLINGVLDQESLIIAENLAKKS